MSFVRLEKEIAGKKFVIETGKMAKQTSGSVVISCGGTSVLVTVCFKISDNDSERDFFPLTVNYIEKFYAVGKVPGGYLKREGRVSDRETLIARLTDRPLRPLFPKSFKSEVQVISTVISADGINSPDVLSMVGASAALSISEVPFNGPIGAVKIGRVNGELILNPSFAELEESDLEVVVAGKKDAVMMVEGQANELPEEDLISAIEYAHTEIKKFIELQEELVEKCAKPKLEVKEVEIPEDIVNEIKEFAYDKIKKALFVQGKMNRATALREILFDAWEHFADKISADDKYKKYINEVFEKCEYIILRKAIATEGKRCDNRGLTDIRPITCEIDVLSQPHGSALFTRGETQSLGVVTLGTKQDMQMTDSIEGVDKDRFMLHYNFPQFSVGETGRLGSPGRREIGHGTLAKRALIPVLPKFEDFPYSIRVVSEILESNGSSSMATVCSGSLSLMAAGVPTSKPVAGIAMGLIKEDNDFFILSDILGTEDHLGDMDFKVAGTKDGVNAIQMDIKIDGITIEIMKKAVAQAKEGRLHILEKMNEVLPEVKENLSSTAPQFTNLKINKNRIRDLIGPGGKKIREIIDVTGSKIDVDDEGNVTIFSKSKESLDQALLLVKGAAKIVDPGEIYTGVVKKVEKFGAFVEILPNCDGLVHISELAAGYVKQVDDIVKEGDKVTVKVIEVDKFGRINLTMKNIEK